MSNRKQIWANNDFVDRLEQIKAKAKINGRDYDSINDLTKEIARMPEFDEVERQLVENQKRAMKRLCRYDGEFE